jgi:hypothetical protein
MDFRYEIECLFSEFLSEDPRNSAVQRPHRHGLAIWASVIAHFRQVVKEGPFKLYRSSQG